MRRVVLEKAAGSLGSFSAGRTASHKVSETGEETARERAAGEANRRNGGQRSATTFSDSRNVYALKDLRIYYKLLAVLGACLGQASAAVRTFTIRLTTLNFCGTVAVSVTPSCRWPLHVFSAFTRYSF